MKKIVLAGQSKFLKFRCAQKLSVFAALALAFFSAPALAETGVFLTATQPSEVLAGDTTFFDVTIWNNQSDGQWFSLAAYPSDWLSFDGGLTSIFIGGYSQRTFRIDVSPPIDARGIRYGYTITAMGEKTGRSTVDVVVPVQQRYAGALLTDFSVSCSECRDFVEVGASVKNVGNINLENINFAFSSGKYTKNIVLEKLQQGEEKTVSAKFLVEKWNPGSYDASVKFSSQYGSDYKTEKFSVPQIKLITTSKSVQKNFWGSTVYAIVRNDGNVEDYTEVNSEKTNDLFVAVYPIEKPSSITGNALTWYAVLKPGEEKTISYSQVFWPIPFGGLFALLLAGYGYMFATAIEIRKSLLGRGENLGVSISVKNKGADADGVVVRDVVPSSFSVIPAFETSKPIMRKTSEGTELLWRLGTVKKGDDVMLHYKIKSSGSAGGALPKAVLRCKRGLSPMQKTSNFVVVPKVPGAQPKKLKVSVVE